jgi:hypothetical protein
MRRTLWWAAAALLWAGPLHGQAPEQRVEQALERAARSGLPVVLLESKIAEGRAKGIGMDRIALAVETRLAALERARTALSRGAEVVSQADLAAGADAVHAGVDDGDLTTLARVTRGESRPVAIVALTELVRQGHASEHALARVREALARGPEALQNLPARAAARGPDTPGRSTAGRGAVPGAGGSRPAGGRPPKP